MRDRHAAMAMVATVMVQLATGFWLAGLRVQGAVPTDDPLVLRVEFIRRATSESQPVPVDRRRASSRRPPLREDVRRHSDAATGADPVGTGGASPASPDAPPLDLTVHAAPATGAPPVRDPFAREPPLGHRATRFDRAWVPAGTALEQASFHSVIAGAALGAFGGPPRRCSEVERRLRKANCLPLHGDKEEREALVRGLDR